MAVLALATAALLGLLLVNRFQLRRQLASYNDLSQQYSALSEAHEEQKASYSELTQQYSALSEAHEEQKALYSELTRQYSALSEAHDVLKERCTALEQTVRDAQNRAESAERELEALRRSPEPTPAPTPTPTPTQTPAPTPTLVPAEQPGMSDAAQSAKENE